MKNPYSKITPSLNQHRKPNYFLVQLSPTDYCRELCTKILNKLINQTTDQLLMEYIIVILKNIFQFINLEGGLQAFFSRMFLSILILFLFFFQFLFPWFIKHGIQTDTACIKFLLTEHLLTFQVNANGSDRILKLSCAAVNNYSMYFFRWKVKLFCEILKMHDLSRTKNFCYRVSDVSD